ncbi:protein lin-54 homolog isoform X2 [Sipha flava]|uniref:Protein lin-54 homolog isoform X2 n=1 Tax=Sipha flava TaxID=143950 RepID=A0A8B8FZC3_9HEMI|nr:protein lin-54 homolog isoform X2 [Sipha flava]
MSNADFDSQDLGGGSSLDSDYLTMLSSSDKLMSGEFEALERLQAELDLFDDPNRTEEIVEQMDVENHLDLIEEEVCSDTGDAIASEDLGKIKEEIIERVDDNQDNISIKENNETQILEQIKVEPVEEEVITLKQPQANLQSEIVTVSSASGTKRSAPISSQGSQQSKKSLLTKVMVNSIPSTSTGRNTQQIVLNVPIGQRPQLGSTRTITLSQARQMGLLAPGCRLQPVASSTNTTQNKNMVVNKISGTIKKGTSSVKSSGPTKILPAPTLITTKNPMIQQQKIFIRQGSIFKQGTLVSTSNGSNQVIRLPSSMVGQSSQVSTIQHIRLPTVNATNVAGLQQVRMPVTSGIQQVQYIRLVPTTATSSLASSTVSVVTTTTVTASTKPQIVTLSTSTPKSNVKTTITKTSTSNTQQPVTNHIKVFSTSSHTVTTSQQRPILPASKPSTSSSMESKKSSSSNTPIPSVNPTTSLKQVSVPKITVKEDVIEDITPLRKEMKNEINLINPIVPKIGRPSSSTASGLSETKPKLSNDVNKTKKPCNCTRSQCLKLYCDCFANGEFCYQCNCNSCFNNMEHEEDRAQAIRSVLDRNPNAFRPKIKSFVGQAERQHTKGCNCKRSGCLKNYCECFEARIACSQNCKCVGCRNVDDDSHTSFGDHSGTLMVENLKSRTKSANFVTSFGSMQAANDIPSQPFKFFTTDVVQATCRCLLARGMEAKKLNAGAEECQRIIIEEFGQCLVKIMDLASEKSFL